MATKAQLNRNIRMAGDKDGITAHKAKVMVRFDQQQRKLLDFLRAEKTFGTEDGEIIRNVVLDWLKRQPSK
jgi:hypothetical protein